MENRKYRCLPKQVPGIPPGILLYLSVCFAVILPGSPYAQQIRQADITLKYVRSIDAAAYADTTEIWGFTRTGTGGICMANAAEGTILFFDVTGMFEKSVELLDPLSGDPMVPIAIHIDTGDMLHVADELTNQIVILDPEGTEQKRFSIYGVLYPEMFLIGDSVYATGGGMRNTDMDLYTYFKYKTEFRVCDIFNLSGYKKRGLGEPITFFYDSSVVVDSEAALGIDSDENIVWSYIYRNRIEKYTPDGDLLFSVERPLGFEPGEFKYTEKEGVIFPKTVTWAIGIDGENRIWVATPERGDPGTTGTDQQWPGGSFLRFDIVRHDGAYGGSIQAPRNFSQMRIFGNALFLLNDTRTILHEYRILN